MRAATCGTGTHDIKIIIIEIFAQERFRDGGINMHLYNTAGIICLNTIFATDSKNISSTKITLGASPKWTFSFINLILPTTPKYHHRVLLYNNNYVWNIILCNVKLVNRRSSRIHYVNWNERRVKRLFSIIKSDRRINFSVQRIIQSGVYGRYISICTQGRCVCVCMCAYKYMYFVINSKCAP